MAPQVSVLTLVWLAFIACAPPFPADIRTPTADERLALDGIAERWTDIANAGALPALTSDCIREHERTLVLIVDDLGIRSECGYCAPGTVGDKSCTWGNAAACLKKEIALDLLWPIAVVHESVDPSSTAVAHESVHSLGYCMRTYNGHSAPELWGSAGVWPL